MKFKLNNKGFTVVEILVVLAIIGIVGSISITKYKGFIANNISGLELITNKREICLQEVRKDPDSEATIKACDDFYDYANKEVPNLINNAEEAILKHEEMVNLLNETVLKEIELQEYDFNNKEDIEELIELIYRETLKNL